MKAKITKIYKTNRDKNGNPLMTKDGRPYERISIKCQEYGDKWLSGFGDERNFNWKEGDEVEIEVKQNGEYLNFKNLSPIDKLWQAINALDERLQAIEKVYEIGNKGNQAIDDIPVIEGEAIDTDNIEF